MFDGVTWTEKASLPESIFPYLPIEELSRFSVQVKNEGWWIFQDDCAVNCNDIKSYFFDKNQICKDGPTFPDYGYSYTPYEFCGTQVNATHTIHTMLRLDATQKKR